MTSDNDGDNVRVLVTGFGAFLDVTRNPSWEIASRLPPSLPSGITVVKHPEPLPAVYRSLLDASPRLIREHEPDIVVHMGLAVDRDYFAVERSANRDGYHQNLDEDKKVITKAESSKGLWGKKSPETLATAFDLDEVLENWRGHLSRATAGSKKKAGKGGKAKGADAAASGFDVRVSDDVGDYVCGLVYYSSLAELARAGRRPGSAIFFHVPPLPTDEDIEKGRLVTVTLIEALAESYKARLS